MLRAMIDLPNAPVRKECWWLSPRLSWKTAPKIVFGMYRLYSLAANLLLHKVPPPPDLGDPCKEEACMRFTSMLAKNEDTFQLTLISVYIAGAYTIVELMVSEHILKFVPFSFSFSPDYHS